MGAPVAPISWYGGKAHLAERIVAMLPRHDTYIEVFGGAGSILFTKPRVTLEVYNDIDSGLVTFFRALRDQPEQLARLLHYTPYAREEFLLCRESWQTTTDDLERARRWYVRMRQAFGCSASGSWGHERNGALSGGTRAASFASTIDQLERFAQRLRGVQVEHLDWREMLRLYDCANACIYLDPPYHPETRSRVGRNHGYLHELTALDHEELVAAVVELDASVLLSGYAHPSYDILERAGFERLELIHRVTTARHPSGRRRTREVIWRRIAPGQEIMPTLWQASALHAASGALEGHWPSTPSTGPPGADPVGVRVSRSGQTPAPQDCKDNRPQMGSARKGSAST
jgi:DNA adenine methylase